MGSRARIRSRRRGRACRGNISGGGATGRAPATASSSEWTKPGGGPCPAAVTTPGDRGEVAAGLDRGEQQRHRRPRPRPSARSRSRLRHARSAPRRRTTRCARRRRRRRAAAPPWPPWRDRRSRGRWRGNCTRQAMTSGRQSRAPGAERRVVLDLQIDQPDLVAGRRAAAATSSSPSGSSRRKIRVYISGPG